MSPIIQLLLLAALEVAGLFALWFILRARIRRYLELGNLLEGVREEARALVIELNETADRNVSLVEDRMASLRELLDEVDRRMGLARRELDSREAEREVYARLSRRRPILPSEAEPEAPLARAVPARAQNPPRAAEAPKIARAEPIPLVLGVSRGGAALPGAIPAEDAPLIGEAPLDGAPPGGAEGPEDPGARDRRRRLPEISVAPEQIAAAPSPREEALRLYRQGFSVDVIAARVGATVAEIELLIELEERRAGA